MPTSLSVFLVTWRRLNQSIKAKVARLITSSMNLLLVVTLDYQQIVSPQPQTASHGCKVFISKPASFCQIISRRFENKINGLSRSRGAPIMSGGRNVFREILAVDHSTLREPKNERLKLRKRSSRSWITIYANIYIYIYIFGEIQNNRPPAFSMYIDTCRKR